MLLKYFTKIYCGNKTWYFMSAKKPVCKLHLKIKRKQVFEEKTVYEYSLRMNLAMVLNCMFEVPS